jgi:hypothetical protein
MLNTFSNPEFRLPEQNFSKKWFGLKRFDCILKILRYSLFCYKEIFLTPFPSLTFRTTGGIFDIYIFMGPTPIEAISQFQQV